MHGDVRASGHGKLERLAWGRFFLFPGAGAYVGMCVCVPPVISPCAVRELSTRVCAQMGARACSRGKT